MKDIVNILTERFRKEHRNARRYLAVLLVLALLTTLFVNWQLHSDGIAATAQYQCGEVEHQHTADCYEKVLVCGYTEGEPEDWNATMPDDDMLIDESFGVDAEEELAVESEPEYIFVPHEHTDDCYQEVKTLNCFEEEHVHTDDCFDPEDGSLICDLFEHTHDDSCYTTEYELVCGLDEGELVEELNPDYNPVALFEEPVAAKPVVIAPVVEAPVHHHTDDCYVEELVCGLPEHHHTVNCLADPQADVEDEAEWRSKTNVTLTGAWDQDLLTVAQSQLGYEQSEKNFQLDTDDGETVRHYTRYGQWYGNPYGDWDVMFLSYCLNYADVPQSTVPQRAGVLALRSDLRGSEWLKDAAEAKLVPGDIVFYNTTSTETVAVDEEQPQVEDDSADADIALLALDAVETEPQTEERTVTTETVGIVSAVEEDGNLTVISGNVDGKVAEVSLSADEITDVIDLAAAYAAEADTKKDEEIDADTGADSAPATDAEGFGATVEWVGEAADPYGIALLADGETSSEDNHDLSKWITNVSYKKYIKKTDTWQDIGDGNATVDSGDTVQVNLKYTVSAGVLTLKNNQLTYQLPGGLTLPEKQSGNIVDENNSNNVVGHYTIDTDGKAILTFTDQTFIGTDETGGLAFTGTFHFSREMKADDINNDKKIEFKDGCTLTINKRVPDAKLNKTGQEGEKLIETLEDGTLRINYQVTVASSNSTNGNLVTIMDHLNYNATNRDGTTLEASYEANSIKLWLVDADGTRTEITSKYESKKTLQNSGSAAKTLTYADLPALEAGETYLLTYSILVPEASFNELDGTGYVLNRAEVKVPDVKTDGYDSYITMNRRLTKEGEYNAETGHIEWKITLRVPNKQVDANVMDGFEITDTLPEGVDIVGNVTIEENGRNKTISAEEFKENGYTVDSSKMKSYSKGAYLVIRFETTTPIGGGEVTNTATATNGGISFSGSDKVTIGNGEWTLNKKLANSGKDPTWNISASNKAGEKSFTLWDVLSDAVNNTNDVQEDTHYAYAAELDDAIKAGLTLTMHDGTKLSYQDATAENMIEITYYSDADGVSVVDADDAETKVRSFRIKVTAGNENNPVRSIAVTGIPTHEERGNVPNGETWTYKNSIRIEGVDGTASAKDSYRSYKQFEKLVAAKSDNDELKYEPGSNSFKLSDLSGGNLHYQLVLQPAAEDTTEITVTDTLPENSTLNTNTIKIALDNGSFEKIDNNNLTWASYEYKEETKLLTIKIQNYNKDNAEHKIRIIYDVNVKGDSTWENPAVSKVTYTNTATWGSLSSSTNTTLTRDVDEVKKTGEKLPDSNRARYQVVINPAGQDLSVNKDHAAKIELWDNVSATKEAIVTGDRDSVELYYYQYDEVNGVTPGKEVPRELYRILDADDKGWLHMEIPNEAAMILVYECEVKKGNAASSYDVNNTVTLSSGAKSSAGKIEYKVNSDATASTGVFRLHKVDSYSGESLDGAEFTIYQYDKTNNDWALWNGVENGVVTTDKKGQVNLTVLADNPSCLNPGVLYKIVETAAPENYRKDDTPHYVLFRTSTQTDQKAFEAATGVGEGTKFLTVGSETIDLSSNVQVGTEGQTTETKYSNVYSRLTVKKLWLDQDTKQPVDPAVEEIQIKVWQYTDNIGDKTLFADVTLSEKNGWTKTWSGVELPLEDENHNEYHYLVEEVTTGNWNVVIDNNGVQTGNITIQNRVFNGYELPSTGGMGTAPFAAVGGVLAAAAVLGGAVLTLKKRKEH